MWQRLHMDHTEPGVTSADGHNYLLNVVEARSGFCWLFPVKTRAASEVAECLTHVVLETGMLPEQLVSDRAKEFLSAWVQSLCKACGLTQIYTSAYHPQSNGVVENLNGRVKRALSRCSGPKENWHKWVKLVEYALRATPREETGLSPFFCMYGREPRFPFDSVTGAPEGVQDLHLEVQKMIDNMRVADEVIGEALRKRARAIERRNEAVTQAVHVAGGLRVDQASADTRQTKSAR